MTLPELLHRFPGARRSGSGWSAKCPAHEDNRASLSIGQGEDGRVLLHCHAGCAFNDIVTALGMNPADLMAATEERRKRAAGKKIVATYPYCDENGKLLFEAVRFEPKDFRQRQPDGKGGWSWKLNGTRRVLYRLPELLNADTAQWVLVVEGEKDADNLRAVGVTATCNPMGAGKWKHVEDGVLAGRKVAILPDRDEPGRKHALDVAQRLRRKAKALRLVELPTTLKDASDFIDARRKEGKTDQEIRDEIMAATEAAADFSPVAIQRPATEGRVSEWADAFITTSIAPTWHREGKTIFSAKFNREIPTGNLWHYLTDADLDALGQTHEAGASESYRGRLMLAKEVIAMAAARAIVTLPEVNDAADDGTVKADELRDSLVAWLLKPRTHRNDNGVILSHSYFSWVRQLEPDLGHWMQCWEDAVFGRIDSGQPRLGVQGTVLASELRYSTGRKLLADLRARSLADTDVRFRIGNITWRGIELASAVFAAVADGGEE